MRILAVEVENAIKPFPITRPRQGEDARHIIHRHRRDVTRRREQNFHRLQLGAGKHATSPNFWPGGVLMRGAYWIAPTRCGSSRQPDSERSSCYLICMAKRLRRREAGRAFGNQARVLAVGEVRRPECGQCRLCQRRGRKKQFASCDMTAALVRSSQKRQRTLRSCAGLKPKCFRVAPCLSSRPIFFCETQP